MEEQNLKLQSQMKRYVRSMGRWYKFFAVVCIVMASLMLVAGVMMFTFGGLMDEAFAESGHPMHAWMLGVVYMVSVVVMVPEIIYLMRAAGNARHAVALNNNEAVARFMRDTKNFWKYCGIVTIVMLGLSVLLIAGAFVFMLVA